MNLELKNVQAQFRKGRGTRAQIVNSVDHGESKVIQKIIYFYFFDYMSAFDSANCKKLWKILKELGTPDHLTCLLRNLYTDQEATVRTGYGSRDWFKIGKRVWQSFILSLCSFNLYAKC